MFPQTAQTIHWSELPPAQPDSPLAAEWEAYRREVGRLLAEGQEGKFALIKGDEIIGIFDTWDEARRVGLSKYLMQPHTVRPILSREPVIRGPLFLYLCQRESFRFDRTGCSTMCWKDFSLTGFSSKQFQISHTSV